MLSAFKKTFVRLLAMVLACGMTVACDGLIFDGEGDCSVAYKVRFRYDMNMKFADAFAHEVNRVTLYVLGEDGSIVWSKTESGEALAAEDYSMVVDVPAGKYDLLAWCDSGDNGSFSVAKAAGKTGLKCSLNAKKSEDGSAYVDSDLDRLYYGYLSGADFTADEGESVVTVSLMKDTNHFSVILQHISGDPVDKSKFDISISADNGQMDWDNSLIGTDQVTYRAWSVESGSADIEKTSVTAIPVAEPVEALTKADASLNVLVAELTTGRLVAGRQPRLVVRNMESGLTVLSVPLVDFALLVKGKYNAAMDDQEFLDRQDDYNMIFFLDDQDRWVNTFIYINSWKIVLQNTEL